jgi:hypothetical protein
MGARSEETWAVHRGGEPVTTKLHRTAEKARKEPGFKFTSLYHLHHRLKTDPPKGIFSDPPTIWHNLY